MPGNSESAEIQVSSGGGVELPAHHPELDRIISDHDFLEKELMRTYAEGVHSGLSMAQQVLTEFGQSKPELKMVLTALVEAFGGIAAKLPQVWQPPPSEVVEP